MPQQISPEQIQKFQKSYILFLSQITHFRKKQLELLQNVAKKLDAYKLQQVREKLSE